MVMTLRHHALDSYVKFSIVSVGVAQKMLEHIRIRMIVEFRKSNSELKCINEIKEIKQLPT